MNDTPRCELCGEPMPDGEEMFKFHGYSGPCPKPPLPRKPTEIERLTAELAQAQEQLREAQEKSEYLCEVCDVIHPVQKPGKILQPCPVCNAPMRYTSSTMRRAEAAEAKNELYVAEMSEARKAGFNTAQDLYTSYLGEQAHNRELAAQVAVKQKVLKQLSEYNTDCMDDITDVEIIQRMMDIAKQSLANLPAEAERLVRLVEVANQHELYKICGDGCDVCKAVRDLRGEKS